MRALCFAAVFLFATPALAADDVSDLLKRQTQELFDAVSNGDAEVWDKYLDANAVITDENGVTTGKKDTVSQVVPLPKGASGTITVTQWHVYPHGDTVIATHVSDEHEDYHGQKLHALYLTTTTWAKEPGGWKVLAQQTLALRQDPPAVALLDAALDDYVGRYRGGPDFIYEITRKGGELMGVVVGGKPGVQKMELRDVMFAPGQPRTRKIFVRDASGHITGFLSRREERDVVWTRIP
ncbi:MAG TPA: nuclear transport factor 2 family protein [Rhizomicrobium sp.]|jgi:ketosteroid isomerase-like protein|nr:nuclear transport factor 2 family protein [Rhizomicrobium sp.]